MRPASAGQLTGGPGPPQDRSHLSAVKGQDNPMAGLIASALPIEIGMGYPSHQPTCDKDPLVYTLT